MEAIYTDKNSWDSKKFRALVGTMVLMIITPLLYSWQIPMAATLAEHLAPIIASALIGLLGNAYIRAQALVDAELAKAAATLAGAQSAVTATVAPVPAGDLPPKAASPADGTPAQPQAPPSTAQG